MFLMSSDGGPSWKAVESTLHCKFLLSGRCSFASSFKISLLSKLLHTDVGRLLLCRYKVCNQCRGPEEDSSKLDAFRDKYEEDDEDCWSFCRRHVLKQRRSRHEGLWRNLSEHIWGLGIAKTLLEIEMILSVCWRQDCRQRSLMS